MFTIVYYTTEGKCKSISVIDEPYANSIFAQLIKAIDAESVALTDGLTGEVITEWEKGEFNVLNRCILR